MDNETDILRCELATSILAHDYGGLKRCAQKLFAKIEKLDEQLEWLQAEHTRVVHQWCREETRHEDEMTTLREELDEAIKVAALIMQQPTLNLDDITLTIGGNQNRDNGVSFMEATSWYIGECHSKKPSSVSSILCMHGEYLNDCLSHDSRQELKRFIPLIINTIGDKLDGMRSRMMLDWLIRTCAPMWLRLIDFDVEAQKLSDLHIVDDESTAAAAKRAIYDAMNVVVAETGVKWTMIDGTLLSISSRMRLEEAIQLSTGWTLARGDRRTACMLFAWIAAIDKGPSIIDKAITELQDSAIALYGSIINPIANRDGAKKISTINTQAVSALSR